MFKTDTEHRLGEILDSEWVRSQFYTTVDEDSDAALTTKILRYQTTADTSIGGSGIGNSRVLNPRPGLNRFADTPRGFSADGITEGSGVAYHELHEKPMDILHLRPGVPRTNPLTTFWQNSFNPDAMESVEYGWIRKAANFVGELLGFIVTIPLAVAGFFYKTLRSLVLGPNANKYNYYYLSPAPFMFWKGLDDMMNTMAIKLGLTGDVRFTETRITEEGTLPSGVNSDMVNIMGLMPGIFSELPLAGGYRMDSITLAHRYNMMHNMRTDYLKEKSQELLGVTFSTDTEYFNAISQWEAELQTTPSTYTRGKSVRGKLEAARNILKDMNTFQRDQSRYEAIMGSSDWSSVDQTRTPDLNQEFNADGTVASTTVVNEDDEQGVLDHESPTEGAEYAPGRITDWQNIGKSVAEGGLDFFSLAVDRVTSGEISVSNSVGPSSIESMFNGSVAASKSAWFSASNGNIGDGAISDTIEGVVGGGKAFLNGLANSVTGGVQQALFGGKAQIDIPNTFQSSSTTLPTQTYTFTSQASCGHPISKLKMLLPVMALLRAAAPISAGPRSFMSPYLVSAIQKGRNLISLGMITDVNVKWGEEPGWDTNDIPCEMQVSFTVANLDKNFHVPLNNSMTDVYNDDSQWDSITNILAGISPTDLDRSWSYNIKTNWARSMSRVDRFFSTSYMATALGAGARSVFEGPIAAMGGYVER